MEPYDCYRKPPRECLICGEEYVYRNINQKYCSRKCFEISHRETMKGENNPAFVDGKSYERRCYRGEGWDRIRKEVYERDNYQCQVCMKICGQHETQAHHIIPYKKTQDNSLENLITLCNVCHPKVEYGKIELP